MPGNLQIKSTTPGKRRAADLQKDRLDVDTVHHPLGKGKALRLPSAPSAPRQRRRSLPLPKPERPKRSNADGKKRSVKQPPAAELKSVLFGQRYGSFAIWRRGHVMHLPPPTHPQYKRIRILGTWAKEPMSSKAAENFENWLMGAASTLYFLRLSKPL